MRIQLASAGLVAAGLTLAIIPLGNTSLFAEICREHGQTDVGLSVIDPVIAKVEGLRAKPGITQWATEYYEQELGYLRKLRARLETERGERKET
ncbi:MAG TPA: hypothetical protein PKA58_29045 [Polyangium sp.]|nr:hypothetical protein [Polyangium sp.]